MAIVNKLSVILEAKTKDFAQGMKKADDKVKKFAESNKSLGDVLGNAKKAILGMNPVVALVGTVAIGATAAIVKLTTATAAYAESLQKASIRTNTSVEDLSKLKFAAEQSGTGFSELSLGLRMLNRTAAEAAKGNKNFVKIYDDLGISVNDANGKLKSGRQLLGEAADAMAKFATSGEKATIGTKILGEDAFARLLPMLEGGAAGLNALTAEADEYGATISTKFANQSAEWLDNVGRMRTLMSGFGNQIAAKVLPVLNDVLVWVIDMSRRAMPVFNRIINQSKSSFEKMAGIMEPLASAWKQMALLIRDVVVGAFKSLKNESNPLSRALMDIGRLIVEVLIEAFTRWGRVMGGVFKTLRGFVGRDLDLIKEGVGDIKTAFTAGRGELVTFKFSAKEAADAVEDDLAPALDIGTEAAERFKGVLGEDIVGAQTFSEALEEMIAAGLAQGPLPGTEQQKFMAGLGERTDGVADKVKNLGETFRDFFDSTFDGARTLFNAFDSLSSALGKGIIDSAKGAKIVFADFFKSLMEQLLQAILRAVILQTILSFIPGFGGFTGFGAGIMGQFTRGLGGPLPAPAGGGGGSSPITGATATPAPRDPGVSQSNVIVHEASPETWVEISDNQIEPRLLQRREELGSEI